MKITRDRDGLQRSLDWVSRHDERSRDYPIRAMLPPAAETLQRRSMASWAPGQILDQGSEGACVGFAWTGELLASPVRVQLGEPSNIPNEFAHAVYAEAKTIDDEPGEDYEGTSVLAGAKVTQRLGYIAEYRWCFDIVDVIQTICHHGPVILGIPWLESMYTPDATGELRALPGSPIVGGHAILANGYHPRKLMHPVMGQPPRAMIHLTNSWGPGWGNDGGAWITVDSLALLLKGDGEACVPVGRHYKGRR